MHPHLHALAERQGGVFTTSQALEHGYTHGQVRTLVRSGEWVRLRRGVLAERARLEAADSRQTHLISAAAALRSMVNPAWLSHRSAALAFELPLLGPVKDEPVLTLERQHRRRADGVELHVAVTPEHQRVVVDDLPVTSPARTLSDLARCRPLREAVVTADAALHRGLCTVPDLERVVADCWVWPGIARTKRMLELVDRRAESPGESLSRFAFARAGLPMPQTQVELLLGGRHVRVDFMWVEHGVVGEFDGKVKYGTAQDLFLEKQREDLIRRHGYRVVRWVWDELYPEPAVMLRRVTAALRD